MNINELTNLSKIGIYCIINTVNGKRYVGSTASSFKQRFMQHIQKLRRGAHANKHLQTSFLKYGEGSFKFEILEIVEISEGIRDLEKHYIEIYKAIEEGYNENPDPNCSPMLNGTTQQKVSEGMKNWWKEAKESMSEVEYKNFCLKYGHEPWNKGKTMTEEQKANMRKPKINGVSDKMKEHNKLSKQQQRDRSPYYLVYDSNGSWVNTFWCLQDLIEYSKTEFNILPVKHSPGKERFGNSLDLSKVAAAATGNKPYKGLFFKRVPKDTKVPCANGVNSWKAEKPIMSLAEYAYSEGAETTGEVQSS